MSIFAVLKIWLRFWKAGVIVFIPILAMPLLLREGQTEQAFKCLYVMVIMASFWVTDALPLGITSLIPIALFPTLGLMSTTEVCKEYFKEASVMAISGLVVAIAVEQSNLHKRIALKAMIIIGTGSRSLLFALMLSTMFMSMWMYNTAITAMMVPIVRAVIMELEKEEDEWNRTMSVRESKQNSKKDNEISRKKTNIKTMFFLSLCYAANIGGSGTLIGTGANLVLLGVLSEISDKTPINYGSWMVYAMPIVLINTFLCWVWLQCWFMGFSSTFRTFKEWCKSLMKSKCRKEDVEESGAVKVLREDYAELGRVKFNEAVVTFLFVSLIILWIFRSPKFVTGWGNFVKVKKHDYKLTDPDCVTNCTYTKVSQDKDAINDATAGVFCVLLLFIIPSKLNFWPFNRNDVPRNSAPSPALLTWSAVHTNMSWSLLLLYGGGFSLAKATVVSGLSVWLGSQLKVLEYLDEGILIIVLCIFTAAATEVTSNTATCTILLPILRELAFSLDLNPLFLMLPVTLSCSYSFMLPVANPSNAVVYEASGMKTSDMLKCGFFLNLICVAVNISCLYIYGIRLYGMDEFPQWAFDAKAKMLKTNQ